MGKEAAFAGEADGPTPLSAEAHLLEVQLALVQASPRGQARLQAARALESQARGAGFLRLARLAREAAAS